MFSLPYSKRLSTGIFQSFQLPSKSYSINLLSTYIRLEKYRYSLTLINLYLKDLIYVRTLHFLPYNCTRSKIRTQILRYGTVSVRYRCYGTVIFKINHFCIVLYSITVPYSTVRYQYRTYDVLP